MKQAQLDELRAEARAFAMEHAQAVEEAGGEDAQAWKALELLAGAGWLKWTVPARDGGHAAPSLCSEDLVSVRAMGAVRAGLAYGSGMLDVMFVEQGLGSYPVARGGREALRARVLPRVADGDHVAAFAVTETQAGSDLSAVSLSAARTTDGWCLSGSKTLITNAGLADGYTVLARSSGEPGERGGLSMFYVSAQAPGISVERFEVMAPHPIGDVHFVDVKVAEDCLLGEEGAGMELALGNLARFRTSVAAAANGFAERALAESVAHLEGRKQFGRPLSSFQGLRFDLAEMDVRLAAAELLVREAALSVDSGADAIQDVARAKLFATETAGWICDRAVQHLGGLGVRRGQAVERLFREVRALRIYEGTSEIQKLILAKELLRRHRSE